MHTQTYTIHTTHSEPTLLEFNQAIESATTPSLNMGHKILGTRLGLAVLIQPRNKFALPTGTYIHGVATNRTFLSKTTCPWNNARGKNQHCRVYLLPTSKFRFPTPFLVRDTGLQSWAANAYEFIHVQNTRRARASNLY